MRHLWNYSVIRYIDFRVVTVILFLMVLSLLTISSMTMEEESVFFTKYVLAQSKGFLLGWAAFFIAAIFDYRKLREWTWPLYLLFLILLAGLFFVPSIQNVHRWYRISFLRISFQPSEYAKLVVVLTLSWFMERKISTIASLKTFFQILLIVAIPFILILKQPDLGTALVLYPIAFVMSFIAGVHEKAWKMFVSFGFLASVACGLVFSGFLSHKEMKPVFTKVLKDYQYARLDPNTYHQKAAKIAVALGGIKGSGFRQSLFSAQKWLPAAHTDSVFAAYAEEYGLLGVILLFSLFYRLLHFGFETSIQAKDAYGRLLACGLTIYLAMHILLNISMMLGLLPITGVPLLLITYGGSSALTTMGALGLLQSIYARRFMFS